MYIFYNESNSQLNLSTTSDSVRRLLIRQRRGNPILQKRIHLLRCPPNKARRIQQRIQLSLDRIKVRVPPNPVDEVVLKPQLLDLVCGFV